MSLKSEPARTSENKEGLETENREILTKNPQPQLLHYTRWMEWNWTRVTEAN